MPTRCFPTRKNARPTISMELRRLKTAVWAEWAVPDSAMPVISSVNFSAAAEVEFLRVSSVAALARRRKTGAGTTCVLISKLRWKKRQAELRKRLSIAATPSVQFVTGAEPGSKRKTCSTCHGRGQVIRRSGFFQMQQPCPTCHGSGSVVEKPCKGCGGSGVVMESRTLTKRIPAGVDTGTRLRSSGDGEAGELGGEYGDLYLVIHVKEHDLFEREGDNLFCTIPIKFTLAALGGKLEVPTLTKRADLKIPAGTQNGTTFRLRGMGMPSLRGSGKGDQFVRIEIDVPKNLSSEQKERLSAFADSCGDKEKPLSESWMEKFKNFFK